MVINKFISVHPSEKPVFKIKNRSFFIGNFRFLPLKTAYFLFDVQLAMLLKRLVSQGFKGFLKLPYQEHVFSLMKLKPTKLTTKKFIFIYEKKLPLPVDNFLLS